MLSTNVNRYCNNYIGYLICNLNNKLKLPKWFNQRLVLLSVPNLTSVDNIVHYIFFEYGQFLCVYDYDRIFFNDFSNNLDFYKNSLHVICNNRHLTIAGCFLTNFYSVTVNSCNVFVEFSSYKDSCVYANKYFYFPTYYFFEKVIYFVKSFIKDAIEKSIDLFSLLGGTITGVLIKKNKFFLIKNFIIFKLSNFKRILGFSLNFKKIQFFFLTTKMFYIYKNGFFYVLILFFRCDILTEIDLIGEIVRFFNVVNINKKLSYRRNNPKFCFSFNLCIDNISSIFEKKLLFLENYFVFNDFVQVINYNFIMFSKNNSFCSKNIIPLNLLNFISTSMTTMCVSLLPGLLSSLKANQTSGFDRVRLFEIGSVFYLDGSHDFKFFQNDVVSGVCCGYNLSQHWDSKKTLIDFFDIKGIVYSICSIFFSIKNIFFKHGKFSFLDNFQSCEVFLEQNSIGFFGLLSKDLELLYRFRSAVYVFELNLSNFGYFDNNLIKYEEFSKFLPIRRDLSIVVVNTLEIGEILFFLENLKKIHMFDVILFDVYNNYANNLKSVSFSFLFYNDLKKVRNNNMISKILKEIYESLRVKFNCFLRDTT